MRSAYNEVAVCFFWNLYFLWVGVHCFKNVEIVGLMARRFFNQVCVRTFGLCCQPILSNDGLCFFWPKSQFVPTLIGIIKPHTIFLAMLSVHLLENSKVDGKLFLVYLRKLMWRKTKGRWMWTLELGWRSHRLDLVREVEGRDSR